MGYGLESIKKQQAKGLTKVSQHNMGFNTVPHIIVSLLACKCMLC